MTMMVVLAAVLLTYGVSPGIAMKAGKSGAVAGAKAWKSSVLPLDMAGNSVDDSYSGCREQMKRKVKNYLQNEKNNNRIFKAVWDRSEKIVLTKFRKWFNKVLQKDQFVAIYSYTDEGVYVDFNNAVRTQGPQYKPTFRYHALHFLLTTAIQAVRAKKKNQCLSVYRRVNMYFRQDVKNRQIRFGSFTSASLGGYANEGFGTKSCFKIVTCMGAEISRYSKFPKEREVLIPPYEVFKVVEIKKRSTKQPKLPCEVVYTVKSTKRKLSKLNCALVPK